MSAIFARSLLLISLVVGCFIVNVPSQAILVTAMEAEVKVGDEIQQFVVQRKIAVAFGVDAVPEEVENHPQCVFKQVVPSLFFDETLPAGLTHNPEALVAIDFVDISTQTDVECLEKFLEAFKDHLTTQVEINRHVAGQSEMDIKQLKLLIHQALKPFQKMKSENLAPIYE